MLDSALSQMPSSGLALLDSPHPGGMSAQPWQCGWPPTGFGSPPANVAEEHLADGSADAFRFYLFCKIQV